MVFLVLIAGISAIVANYVCRSTSQPFFDQKAHEKATALQLVDTFVTTYSRVRSQFGPDAPVPATFRAHSIEGFNKKLGENGALLLRWLGRPGREIKSPPVDAEMAETIEELAASADRKPKSELIAINDQRSEPSIRQWRSAQETNKIVATLGEVASAAVATRASAEIVLTASQAVESAVENMRGEVDSFLHNVAS